MIPNHKKIKMRAHNAKELHHIAEQLRDGLCPLVAMVYEKNSFTLLVNRFCWNHKDIHENSPLYYRAHVGLLFNHVQSVQRKGFNNNDPYRLLNLLHISVEEKNKKTFIHLMFSQHRDIRLQVNEIETYVSDLHEAWPTRQKPTHLHEHAEQLAAFT